ncbi:hypothetical protein [Flavilitoribacter nigricans]|uniref:PH domain-containing protein n=1 Tax=Flavilitoribacter nigricans (strain ATCC 23147 / DSM 23189 / NBRC 102662 / NCIMB 1420 / SS-2) TaxID=1122177 RepID=A0A2D0N274_FLAN2|nr:hypothetical protein [Flavilitoribacter nigricans]PHN02547.1 hypothetical protein CRP01_31725 [Flavilitoribacter nigricans DSM 23189 = NBRC 102662]
MKGKEQVIPSQTLIFEQSPTMKRIGYCLAIAASLVVLILAPGMKLEHVKAGSLPMLMIALLPLIWVFIFLPYVVITTKKRLIIKGDRFVIKSNRKKYAVNKSLKDMVWWREISAMAGGYLDVGDKIQIQFSNRKIMLHQLEFKNFPELKQYFKNNHREKEKKVSR